MWLLLTPPNFDVSFTGRWCWCACRGVGHGRIGTGGGGSGGRGSVVVAHCLNGVGKPSWFSQIARFRFGRNMFCLFCLFDLPLLLLASLLRFFRLLRFGFDLFNGVGRPTSEIEDEGWVAVSFGNC